jgi:hypothetical protein
MVDEEPNKIPALAIVVVWVVLVAITLVAMPFVNAFVNPSSKVVDNINNTLQMKSQMLVFADQIGNMKWEAMSMDETTFYYYTFNEDGTKIENTFTKRKSTKPYLYWINDESGGTGNFIEPINITKKSKTMVDFIYVGDDVDSYVNYLIVPLLREALPSTTINEYCYVNCTSNETVGMAKELVDGLNISKTPAIVINEEYVNIGLIGAGQQSTKARYEDSLKFLCLFIEGEPKCA